MYLDFEYLEIHNFVVDTDKHEKLKNELARLQTQYIEGLSQKWVDLQNMWAAFSQSSIDRGETSAWKRFRDHVHKLIGTAAAYGLPLVSQRSRELESRLDALLSSQDEDVQIMSLAWKNFESVMKGTLDGSIPPTPVEEWMPKLN